MTMFELLLLIYMLPVCVLIGLLIRLALWLISRNAAVGIMAGKENFCLDMEAGDACVCAGYFRQSVPAAFGRIKVA